MDFSWLINGRPEGRSGGVADDEPDIQAVDPPYQVRHCPGSAMAGETGRVLMP
jgi:hypothetical protein